MLLKKIAPHQQHAAQQVLDDPDNEAAKNLLLLCKKLEKAICGKSGGLKLLVKVLLKSEASAHVHVHIHQSSCEKLGVRLSAHACAHEHMITAGHLGLDSRSGSPSPYKI